MSAPTKLCLRWNSENCIPPAAWVAQAHFIVENEVAMFRLDLSEDFRRQYTHKSFPGVRGWTVLRVHRNAGWLELHADSGNDAAASVYWFNHLANQIPKIPVCLVGSQSLGIPVPAHDMNPQPALGGDIPTTGEPVSNIPIRQLGIISQAVFGFDPESNEVRLSVTVRMLDEHVALCYPITQTVNLLTELQCTDVAQLRRRPVVVYYDGVGLFSIQNWLLGWEA